MSDGWEGGVVGRGGVGGNMRGRGGREIVETGSGKK